MSKYLLNAWYVAGFSDEVNDKPISRKILEQDLVFYRTDTGNIACLIDRCPHRFAPLSAGSIVNGKIRCGYHGLIFDKEGTCVRNPHGDGRIPPNSSIKSYHVIEKYGFIWLWAGDANKAYEGLIPNYDFLITPDKYSPVKGMMKVQGNYLLVVDNLLDLSHAAYLHPEFSPNMDVEEYVAAANNRLVKNSDRSLTLFRTRHGIKPNPSDIGIFGYSPDDLFDYRTNMTWHAPSILNFDVGKCLLGHNEEDGICIPQAHCITPETEFTSHYFFACGRNMRRDEKEIDDIFLSVLENAFRNQDEPMIAAVQSRMGNTSDIDSLKPVLLASDQGPVAARRMLASLLKKESA